MLCCVELLCASTGTGVTFLRLGLGLRVRVRLCECVRLYAVSFHPFSKRLYSLQKTVSHPLLYPLIPFSAPAPGSVFSDVSPPLSASSASVTACFGASIASAPGIFLDYGLFLGYGIFGLGSIRARVFLSKCHFGLGSFLARFVLGSGTFGLGSILGKGHFGLGPFCTTVYLGKGLLGLGSFEKMIYLGY